MELTDTKPPNPYRPLQKYLDERYANTVVLFFREIEDILGFPLPGPAWLRPDWWSTPATDEAPSDQSLSWTNARRTARVNLTARKVMFTRVSA